MVAGHKMVVVDVEAPNSVYLLPIMGPPATFRDFHYDLGLSRSAIQNVFRRVYTIVSTIK